MNLVIQNLHFHYKKNSPVLRGLDLSIAKGEKHGILGKNGAGKTTFFRLMAGWMKGIPASSLLLDGQALKRQDVAFLEAEPTFYPYMTGMEFLRFIRDEPRSIETWNAVFGLPLERYAQDYSTGMRKKLALIAAFLQDRPVLILDEPFNGVDLESNEKILALLRQGITKNAATLISSHILDTLTSVCDRISVLDEGKFTQTYEKSDFRQLEQTIRNQLL